MSMCTGCKTAADETATRRRIGSVMVPKHPCDYPHTCTCQHNRRPVVGARKRRMS